MKDLYEGCSDIEEEVWRDVAGFEDRYEVSNRGRVRSKAYTKWGKNKGGAFSYVTTPGILKQNLNDGYPKVTLERLGERKTVKVHKLVALAFISNPDNLPVVNHKDSDRTNNNVSNLEWCTQQYNVQHSYDTGSNSNAGDLHPSAVLSAEIVKAMRSLHAEGKSIRELVQIYGFKYHTINKAIRRRSWSHVE